MARKIFISILGTSPYLETRYYFGQKETGNEKVLRFVQEATVSEICKGWSGNDKVIIFLTNDARTKNWIDNGNSVKYDGLKTRLESLNYNFKIIDKDIPEGFSEKEIWDIFQKVYDEIDEDSEIYFDITHAFRSLPMLVMVLINYAKFLKNVTVKGIYYGAFEKLGPAFKVKDIPIEKRFAPILDLTAFSELQDWTSAAISFTKFGKTEDIINLLKKSNNKINLYDFSKDIIANRGIEILSSQKILSLKKQLKNENFEIEPFNNIKSIINEKIRGYKQNNVNNGFIAIKYCLENDLIQQAATLMQEFIVTKVMYDIGYDNKDKIRSNNYRKIITSFLQRNEVTKENCRFFLTERDKKSETKMMKKLKILDDINVKIFSLKYKYELTNEIFIELSDKIRNDINHAGFRTEPMQADDFKLKLEDYLKKLIKLFDLNI